MGAVSEGPPRADWTMSINLRCLKFKGTRQPNPAPTQPHLESLLKPPSSLLDSSCIYLAVRSYTSEPAPRLPAPASWRVLPKSNLLALILLHGFTQNKSNSSHDTLHYPLTI